MKKKIILVSGDPNSVNSEIIYKCWKKLPEVIKKNIYLVSNYKLLTEQFKKLNYKIKLEKVKNISILGHSSKLKVIDVKLIFKDPFKVSRQSSSIYILKSLNLAHHFALNKKVAGIVNCPIDKNLLNKKNIGVTEFLASKCNIRKNTEAMVIKNDNLMVSPITTHLNIKSISKKLKKSLIINKVKTINDWYKKSFKKNPKIAILGLNPHNGELRKNSEEQRIIIPAINKLKRLGIFLKGPYVSDTIFINDYKKYDIIIGMYHDQVLSPFKALFKFNAINLTLGLNYIRVSPDHGVAKDKILQKKSNPDSLFRCIAYVNKFSK